MQNVIEADSLSFSYGSQAVVSGVSFSVRKGDFLAIIGSNGTGKSTLLRLILGEIPPAAGSIRLFGQDIRQFRDWPKLGYVPQNGLQPVVNFPATTEEIVTANLFSQIGLFRFPKKEHWEKTRRALELVDIAPQAKRLIGELSGGQQQRAVLARVLVSDPEIMLLDEPTTGVDAGTVRSLYELLSRLNREKGLTILMVTHDISRAANYVSRILWLEEGSLAELDKDRVEEELSHRRKRPVEISRMRRKGDDEDARDTGI